MIKITTEIFDGYTVVMKTAEVDGLLFQEVMQHLDLPTPKADSMARMICTPSATIKRVMTDRTVLAKQISETITKQLLDYMSDQDTVMGYKKETVNGRDKA